MPYGPIELVALQTPEPVPGDVVLSEGMLAALRDLVESHAIRIVDIAFVHADRNGVVTTSELGDLTPGDAQRLGEVVTEVTGLISQDDIAAVGDLLRPATSAAVLLLEQDWAVRLSERTRRAGGKVLLHLRVPRETIVEAEAARGGARS
ncbi:MAG TPA: DUF6325 family protein [Candidatus Limnocylindria bacterium]|nr:DUF6325 family protein [Candidatus Limnocylindria bacterium]